MHSGTRAGLMVVLGLATIAIETGASPVQAQTPVQVERVYPPPPPPPPPPRRHIPRITVVPLSRYHRQCDFWLAVEHRPSGDVITPQQHCWWALR